MRIYFLWLMTLCFFSFCLHSFESLPTVLLSRSEVNGPGADVEIRKTTPSIFLQSSYFLSLRWCECWCSWGYFQFSGLKSVLMPKKHVQASKLWGFVGRTNKQNNCDCNILRKCEWMLLSIHCCCEHSAKLIGWWRLKLMELILQLLLLNHRRRRRGHSDVTSELFFVHKDRWMETHRVKGEENISRHTLK